MRLFVVAVTFLSALFAPVWAFFLLAGFLAVRYPSWEVMLIAFFMDLVYLPIGGFFGIPFVITILVCILVWGLDPLRNQLVFK
ncbi:MAG: hypothetical protein COV01_01315 [Candidatus Taylorbacteria bacterium CG10_big_fil_rev_8_21_14_0_10_41_48]|uniref:Uncharacterized protein n=1 Tax=Candidatus Taylorbacteria bacterium CG10_big_fil_rev_8_21_14_0_10_41_48 TaxID=1975024 RepID=A0A2M8LCN3_9BACT|nr:MAG: hypothetical protein COV01_01315 [Candidatus Taylorbacteria bacterium CG10_big_fil_rev_8_21_14_0_10_41_48]